MTRTRDAYALALAGAMGLAVVAGLGHARLRQLRDDVDQLTTIVADREVAAGTSRVDPEPDPDPTEAGDLARWSRHDADDRPFTGRYESFDRRPSEGGAR